MDFSRFFVDRPIFAAVLSILITVAGLIAIPNLPVSEYPEIAPPAVQVRAIYPGADSVTLAETVAAPIEEAVNGVENMIYMKSTAGSDGVMQLTVSFKIGTDIDLAAVQVQNRVAQALPRLPEEVRQLGVTTIKQSPNLTMVVHLRSPDQRYDTLYLRNYATLRVRDELSRLTGVGQAVIFGGGDYSMRIWLNPDQLASRGLSAGDVVRAIREQNIQVSAGAIGAPPQPGGSLLQLSINSKGRLDSPEAFARIVLKVGDDGVLVRLGEVAQIELGASEYASRSLLDNDPAVAIVIFEAPGANTVALSDAVRARMAELAERFPQGVEWTVVYDPTVFVRQSISAVITTLLEAVLLVVLVVIVFLQTWRASVIPLLAVPVSIIGTFAVLWLLGYTINVLTLFGLVLAIGIVVDDAIVVVENVERNIAEGLAPLNAAHQAMREVSGPIVAIGLVLTSVFVPISFLPGVTGEFYRQFAVTIAISVVISTINSLTLSPALSALLLKPHGARKDPFARLIDALFGWFFRPFNRLFQSAGNAYASSIGGIVRKTALMLFVYVALLGGTFLSLTSVPLGFIPTQDKQYLFGVALLPEGASLDRTEEMIRKMSALALATPGVESAVAFPGVNGVHFTNTPNTGTIFFGITPAKERDLSAEEIAGQLSFKFSELKEGLAFAFMPPPLFGYGNAAGFEMYLQDRGGLGYGELHQQVQNYANALRAQPGFNPYSVFSSYQANVPSLKAVVDRDRVKQQGLALTEVYEALQVYLGSAYVNDINLFGRTYTVYAQAAAEFRDQIEDIGRLKVRNAAGEMVPVDAVVDVERSYGPDPVIRYNGYPAADLGAAADPAQMSSSAAINAATVIAKSMLPADLNVEWTGLTYQQLAQGTAGLLVFPLCVLLVYLVLAALYESWTLPLAVILIVPLAILAALGGSWLLNTINGTWFGLQIASGAIPPPPMSVPPTMLDLNVFTQIGLVVLMGLACKNAILIVEFARDLERQGRGVYAAAIEACRLRLRPILMTSLAFIMGVVPLVLATGPGAEIRHVMGVTVFAGMLGVTLFGLFLTPVFYVVLRRMFASGNTQQVQGHA